MTEPWTQSDAQLQAFLNTQTPAHVRHDLIQGMSAIERRMLAHAKGRHE